MKLAKFSNEWVTAEVARTWPEGIVVMVQRPWRSPGNHGWLELDPYFRPDCCKSIPPYNDPKIRYMKVTV